MTHTAEDSSQPAHFLADNIGLLPRGRALDVAMGSGQNSVYLARMGFQVEGIDISAEALNNALELAQKNGVTINAKVIDLEAGYYSRYPRAEPVALYNSSFA
jgi:tellurite methyltransferase